MALQSQELQSVLQSEGDVKFNECSVAAALKLLIILRFDMCFVSEV